jgi:hypothetical protein
MWGHAKNPKGIFIDLEKRTTGNVEGPNVALFSFNRTTISM